MPRYVLLKIVHAIWLRFSFYVEVSMDPGEEEDGEMENSEVKADKLGNWIVFCQWEKFALTLEVSLDFEYDS